jgi:phosphonate transport system substrate-binding protein
MDRRHCVRLLSVAGISAVTDLSMASTERLRIGLTPVILADQVAFLTRWSRYLSEKMSMPISFVARESYQSVLDLLFGGQVDAAWICGYPYVRFQSSMTLLNVPLYQGSPTYQAYLIRTRAPTVGIRGWADLDRKVLAYSDPLSNSGWLVAQAQLAKAGLSPQNLRRSFFAYGHRNVAEAVAAGLAQAGSMDGYVWETMQKQGMNAIEQTEVVWKSDPFGFPPIVALKNSKQLALYKLQKTLIDMNTDIVGQELLAALNLTGFTLGTESMFESIRKQAKTVPSSGV